MNWYNTVGFIFFSPLNCIVSVMADGPIFLLIYMNSNMESSLSKIAFRLVQSSSYLSQFLSHDKLLLEMLEMRAYNLPRKRKKKNTNALVLFLSFYPSYKFNNYRNKNYRIIDVLSLSYTQIEIRDYLGLAM